MRAPLPVHVMESKAVLDSGFQAVDSRFQILCQCSMDSGFLEFYSGFQSSGFQIPQATISRIPESEFPNMARFFHVFLF